MPVRIQVAEDRRPHFFLSYARSRYRPADTDPDRWVKKLFDDLCLDVHQATGMPNPGFMDRQIPVGTAWPDHLSDALANCRVFVALFSPAYFTSEYCGKEWAAFEARALAQAAGADRPFAIIPALWMPMKIAEMPAAVHSIQNIPPGFPPAYSSEGLYGIMKLARYRERYKETVLRLAGIIKERAAESDLRASPIPDLDSLTSPFLHPPAAERRPPVRLVVAAHRMDQIPEGRESYYYGRTALEWSPFRSHDLTMPIGVHAQRTLVENGEHTVLEAIDDPRPHDRDAPTVMLVDPWAALDPAIGDKLRHLDRDAPCSILAPFSTDDPQTSARSADLVASLHDVLGRSALLPGSTPRLTSIDAFDKALAKAVGEAVSRFFRTTDAHPPQKSATMPRPRLQGPDF